MSLYRPALLPIILLISCVAVGQTRGGGRPATFTNPATDARNAAVMGKGDNSNLSTVRLNSANDEPRVEFRSQTVLIQVRSWSRINPESTFTDSAKKTSQFSKTANS